MLPKLFIGFVTDLQPTESITHLLALSNTPLISTSDIHVEPLIDQPTVAFNGYSLEATLKVCVCIKMFLYHSCNLWPCTCVVLYSLSAVVLDELTIVILSIMLKAVLKLYLPELLYLRVEMYNNFLYSCIIL